MPARGPKLDRAPPLRLALAQVVEERLPSRAPPAARVQFGEEITRIRRLINRIKGDIAELDDTERTQIDDAVAIMRRHRAAHTIPLGMPTLAATAPAPATTASEATA